jgi:site-specific recombinase XerC
MSVEVLKTIPEEAVWLKSRKNARTRRAYRTDVAHFMRTFTITSPEELGQIDHRAVYAWERQLREVAGKEASTVRRRLAAFSSLFTHLIKYGVVEQNPVRDVERPAVNRREGMTRAFSQKQARKILDAPNPETVMGLRDRAILSVGLQVGFRCAEIASLKVKDLHEHLEYDSLRVTRKGGKKGSLAIHQQAAQRIKAYLEKAGHKDDLDGPLFRPVKGNREGQDARRHLHPDVIDRIKSISLCRGRLPIESLPPIAVPMLLEGHSPLHPNGDTAAAFLRCTVCHANLHIVSGSLSGSSGGKRKLFGPRVGIALICVIDPAAYRLLDEGKRVCPAHYRSDNPHYNVYCVAYTHINLLGGGCEFYRVLLPDAIDTVILPAIPAVIRTVATARLSQITKRAHVAARDNCQTEQHDRHHYPPGADMLRCHPDDCCPEQNTRHFRKPPHAPHESVLQALI